MSSSAGGEPAGSLIRAIGTTQSACTTRGSKGLPMTPSSGRAALIPARRKMMPVHKSQDSDYPAIVRTPTTAQHPALQWNPGL
jgi:hypothetical protein